MNRLIPGLTVLLLAACQVADPSGGAPAPDAAAPVAAEPAPASASASASAEAPATDAVGAELPTHPTLVVDTLDHGRFELAERRGTWVVVNFWATWCKPCLKEIPDLTAFDAAREDVEVIGLAYEEISPDDLRAFLARHPAGYPVAIVDVYDPPADFETPRGLPLTYLIGPDGAVAKKFLGPVTSQDLAAAIDAAAAPGADAG